MPLIGNKTLEGKKFIHRTDIYTNNINFRVICGITEDTESSHIVRAALEAVSFQTRDILEAMTKDCGFPLTELQVNCL